MNELQKKYGLFTAICMVAGIVIGSGVFFKAQVILQKTGGDMPLGIWAWIIGGIIMLCCVLAFANMAQKHEKVNGIVDYAEALVSPKYGYVFGWFMTFIYYPTLTCALAWLSARYTLVFISSCWPDFPLIISAADGGAVIGPECMTLTLFYLCASYAVNALSPKLAGKFQTSTTVIKLIPLLLMAVVGIVSGLFSKDHMLVSNFGKVADATLTNGASTGSLLLTAVCATSFAYEGWIVATSINAELKDSKKNLPIALITGSIIIIAVYVTYYIGVAGGATVESLMNDGATVAFTNIFGGLLGNILNLCVAISCMGTMNGLMLGCCRGMYSISARGEGPKAKLFSQVDKESNIPTNSSILGLLLCAVWTVYFYLTNLAGVLNGVVVFKGTILEGPLMVFDPTELPIITIYFMYLPIFIMWMVKTKGESVIKRFIIPSLAIIGSLFMVYACLVGHKQENFWYIITFAVIMAIGLILNKKKAK